MGLICKNKLPDQTPADIKVNLSGTLPSKGKLREAQICFNEFFQCKDEHWKPWKSITKDKMTFSAKKVAELGISKRGKFKIRIFVERPTAKKNRKKVISQLRTYDSATVKHQTRYETAGRVQEVVVDVGLAGLELQMPAVVAFDITTFPTTLKGWQDMAIKSTPPDISYIKSVTCFNKGGSNSSPQVISIGSKNKDRKLDLLEKGCLQANDSVTLENPVEVTFILQPPAGHGFVTAGENPSLAEIDTATIVIFHCTPVCELKTKTLRFENGNIYTVNENSAQKLAETFDQIFASETSTEVQNIIASYSKNKIIASISVPYGLSTPKYLFEGIGISFESIKQMMKNDDSKKWGPLCQYAGCDGSKNQKDFFQVLFFEELQNTYGFQNTTETCKNGLKSYKIDHTAGGKYMCTYWPANTKTKHGKELWYETKVESCGIISYFYLLLQKGMYKDNSPHSYAQFMIDSYKNGISSGNTTNFGWGKKFPGMKPGEVALYCRCPDGSCKGSICKDGKTSFDKTEISKYDAFIMRAGGGNLVNFGHYWPFFKDQSEYVAYDFNPQEGRRNIKLNVTDLDKMWEAHAYKKDKAGNLRLINKAYMYIIAFPK